MYVHTQPSGQCSFDVVHDVNLDQFTSGMDSEIPEVRNVTEEVSKDRGVTDPD